MDRVADGDLADPNPDVAELLRHYDRLYFRGALAGFSVQWASPRVASSSGSCTFGKAGNTITLSEPLLKYRSNADLKNTLLHEMIHAILYVKHDKMDRRQHGPIFRAWMDAINSCSINDNQRPPGGYYITTRHDFIKEEPHTIKGFQWKCESCGDLLLRAMNQGAPSDVCCIENVDNDATCGNMLCHWHKHKTKCGGTYARIVSKPLVILGQKKVPKGTHSHLTDMPKMSKSHKAIQDSDLAELQENATIKKPNAVGKFLSLVGGRDAKSQGSSGMLGGSDTKSSGSSSSKKAGKRHKPEDVQETSDLLAAPLIKLKQANLVASEKHEVLSPVGCSNAQLLDSGSSKKAGKQHKPEDIQNTCALPAPSPRKLKQANLVASEKHNVISLVGCSSAKLLGSSSSKKPGKQHKPEEVQNTCALPAAPLSKLKQANLVASEKQERKCKTRKSARQKEFAVASEWLNYYESEESSGSIVPLVNKRTERRKRYRNQITYSRSRKRGTRGSSFSSVPLGSSRINALVCCQNVKTQAPENDSSQQAQPPAPCLDIVVAVTADQVVTQTPGDLSHHPLATCLDIVLETAANQAVPFQSVGPPCLFPCDESVGPAIIDISDDD